MLISGMTIGQAKGNLRLYFLVSLPWLGLRMVRLLNLVIGIAACGIGRLILEGGLLIGTPRFGWTSATLFTGYTWMRTSATDWCGFLILQGSTLTNPLGVCFLIMFLSRLFGKRCGRSKYPRSLRPSCDCFCVADFWLGTNCLG